MRTIAIIDDDIHIGDMLTEEFMEYEDKITNLIGNIDLSTIK